MALTGRDWAAIYQAIRNAMQPSTISQGVVIKSDQKKGLVWLAEFGDQPIPIIGFDYEAKYYYVDATGKMQTGRADCKLQIPGKGATVLVLKQYGSRRLPKCIGVLKGTDFILSEGESVSAIADAGSTGGRDMTPLTQSDIQNAWDNAPNKSRGGKVNVGCVMSNVINKTPTSSNGQKMVPHMVVQTEQMRDGTAQIKYEDPAGGSDTIGVSIGGCISGVSP